MQSRETAPLVAIACGGTGGHLFPGLAVAGLLSRSGCRVQLLVSSKEVDREAVKAAAGMDVVPLPAVGLQRRNPLGFVLGLWKSHRRVSSEFRRQPPAAVLAMGGFTSAAPILRARALRLPTFIHESNSVPGRANRWLAPRVDQAFVSFPSASRRLRCRQILQTGTPVRTAIRSTETPACRQSFGFDRNHPVLLVAGGSQGARAVNTLVVSALPGLFSRFPDLQILHLTGREDYDSVLKAGQPFGNRVVVRPFLSDIEMALGAATVAVSRAGASSLAEFAAARLPAVLIPYPAAADNHQFFNARAYVESGAALLLEQDRASAELLTDAVGDVIGRPERLASIRAALARWDRPDAAQEIVTRILAAMRERGWSVTLSVDTPMSPSPGSETVRRSSAPSLAVA